MRIKRVHVDGYGRLSDVSLDFDSGLNVIVGPNERGKSTLRAFITDMLYGQRREDQAPGQAEDGDLRRPWVNPDIYGGRLWYELSRGGLFEVRRSFVKGRGRVSVIESGPDRDITATFPLLSNREVNFAGAHLGLSRGVFTAAATIGHLNLDGLGDADAMARIRARLLAITDSGLGTRSADEALAVLQERIDHLAEACIAPLEGRLAEVRARLADAESRRRALAPLNRRRAELRRRIAGLEAERDRLRGLLRRIQAHRRAGRLQDAERIQQRIDTVTQQSFPLVPFRDVSTAKLHEAQQARMMADTARLQAARRETELSRMTADLEAIEAAAASGGGRPPTPIPEETERRFHELRTKMERFSGRLEEANARLRQIEEQTAGVQRRLADLPDFTRMATDPVEWLTQLANAFTLALRAREQETAARDRLLNEVAAARLDASRDADLFQDTESFSERLRAFDEARRRASEKRVEAENRLHSLGALRDDLKDRLPGMAWLSGVCGVFLALLAAVFLTTGRSPVLYPGAIILLAMAYFVANWAAGRRQHARMSRQLGEAQAELDKLAAEDSGLSPVEMLLKRANCGSLRELEARYDRHREETARLNALVREMEQQEIRVLEAETRVPKLFLRLQEAFLAAGEVLEDEDTVQSALSRTISRYQEHREAKRRMSDLRNQMQLAIEQQRESQGGVEKTREALERVEGQIRDIMRDCGCAEQADSEDLLAALRAYADLGVRRQSALGQAEMLRRQLEEGRALLEEERAERDGHTQTLHRLLDAAGAASVEEWLERAEKAREYRSLQQSRLALEEQLDLLLDGLTLAELRRAAAEAEGDPPEMTQEQAERELARLEMELGGLNAEHGRLCRECRDTETGADPAAPLKEEEDRLTRALAEARLRRDALLRAAALIEDAAQRRHARIAPPIAEDASRFLRVVTGGEHGELRIGADFGITLDQAAVKGLEIAPQNLSKGALDQLYLSLRLALVRLLSANGEAIPMLLDDPFANYDDQRLRAAMGLLKEVGDSNQVLLFTCREDVGLAACGAGATIHEI